MCRITGFLDINKNNYSSELIIKNMTEILKHGGPDSYGYFQDLDGQFALGHRRLKIIELSEIGSQPIKSPSGRYILSYNGEIYNFIEIKKELEKLGYKFKGLSDTEVLAAAWDKWQINVLNKLRGMFAFAVWDKEEKNLTLVRDRLGVKPLFYYYKDNTFLFASELKAFKQHPNFSNKICHRGVSEFLQFSYISEENTIFENTYKLIPGQYLIINSNGIKAKKIYWDSLRYLSKNNYPKYSSDKDYLDELEKLLEESVNLRTYSDVPLGCFLSGGIDSSLIASLMQKSSSTKINTFTVGFDNRKFDESSYAKEISKFLGTNHRQLNCSGQDALDAIENISYFFDEPMADGSSIPTYLVSKLASSEVKVCLSGDGGDELFYGYDSFSLIEKTQKIQSKKYLCNLTQFLSKKFLGLLESDFGEIYLNKFGFNKNKLYKIFSILSESTPSEQFKALSTNFYPYIINELIENVNLRDKFNHNFQKKLQLNQLLTFFYLNDWLPNDGLVKVDRASMANGLEVRGPLLDHKLAEFALMSNHKFKVRKGKKKWALKEILKQHIPLELFNRPKKGFGVPIASWLKNEFKELVYSYLDYESICNSGVLNPSKSREILNNFYSHKSKSYNQIWNILILQMWIKKWG